MDGRGKRRPGTVAKCIYVLIIVVGLATLALGIYVMRREPPAVRGSQSIPAQAAEQTGEQPRPSPRPN